MLFIRYMLFFFLLRIFLSILISLPLFFFLTVVGNIVAHISLLKLLKILFYTFFLQVSWIFIKLNLSIFFFLRIFDQYPLIVTINLFYLLLKFFIFFQVYASCSFCYLPLTGWTMYFFHLYFFLEIWKI